MPAWLKLAELQARFGSSEVLSEVETSRLDQAFRHQFLRMPENRPWLTDRLPLIFTPRLAANLGTNFLSRLYNMVRK